MKLLRGDWAVTGRTFAAASCQVVIRRKTFVVCSLGQDLNSATAGYCVDQFFILYVADLRYAQSMPCALFQHQMILRGPRNKPNLCLWSM